MLHGKHILLEAKMVDRNCLSKYTIKPNDFCNIWNARILMCAPSRQRVKIHLPELFMYFSWPELQVSAVPLRFLLFFHCFSTIEICFPYCMGVKFHIIIALLLERSEKHICVCNTSSKKMQFLYEFCFPCCMGTIFCLKQKWWTETGLSKYIIKLYDFCNIWNARILMCAPSRQRVKIHLLELSMSFSWPELQVFPVPLRFLLFSITFLL